MAKDNVLLVGLISIIFIIGLTLVVTSNNNYDFSGQFTKSIGTKPLPQPIPLYSYEEIFNYIKYDDGNLQNMTFDLEHWSGDAACKEENLICTDVIGIHKADNNNVIWEFDANIPCNQVALDSNNNIHSTYSKYLLYSREFFLQEGEIISFGNKYDVSLERVGQNSTMVSVTNSDSRKQTKVILLNDKEQFEAFDDIIIEIDSLFYIAGAEDNGANIFIYFDSVTTEFEAKCSKQQIHTIK